MNLSKTNNRKDTQKFLIALAIYIIAIIFTDTMITNKTYAPAHLQNDKEQGQTYHTGELRMLDRPTQPVEPSRGGALPSSRGRELTLQATAYTWTGRKTATGPWPKQGKTVAVNPEIIPFHSRIYIEGVDLRTGRWEGGWFVAEDRLPRKSIEKGASIDIYVSSEKSCWEWGRRNVRVVIIPPQ